MFAQGKLTIDQNVIMNWAQARKGWPAIIRKVTGTGIDLAISIVFPGYKNTEVVRQISWNEFFELFNQQHLVFIYQEEDNSENLSKYFEMM